MLTGCSQDFNTRELFESQQCCFCESLAYF